MKKEGNKKCGFKSLHNLAYVSKLLSFLLFANQKEKGQGEGEKILSI